VDLFEKAQSLVPTPKLKLKVSHDQVVVMNQTIRSKVRLTLNTLSEAEDWSLSLSLSLRRSFVLKAAGTETATEHRPQLEGIRTVRLCRPSFLAPHAPPDVAFIASPASHALACDTLRSVYSLHSLQLLDALHPCEFRRDTIRRPSAVALSLPDARLAIHPVARRQQRTTPVSHIRRVSGLSHPRKHTTFAASSAIFHLRHASPST
jgi:hypothetical protein